MQRQHQTLPVPNHQGIMPGSSQALLSKSRPALRLVKTKDMPREEWLNIRRKGIGSSDAAAAVGLNPYKSALELWMEKTGRDVALARDDVDDESTPTYWGNILEPIVALHYARRSGHRVRRINAVLQHPDPKLDWMLANIDREVIGSNEVQLLECKTAGINGVRLWKGGVPEYVRIQVMHQLAVTGKQAADVAVLLGGQNLEIHRIERDEADIQDLIEKERQFWHYVVMDTPPPADGSPSSDRALRTLHPNDDGQRLDFRHEAHLSATFQELLEVREVIAAQEKRESTLKQTLQQAMGDASFAMFELGSVSWKKSKDSIGLDTKALLKDMPKLEQLYAVVKPGSRRFLID